VGTVQARLVAKLRPGSRLRRAILWREARIRTEAFRRRDLDAVVVGFHPEFEWYGDPKWVEAGILERCYRGVDGYRAFVAAFSEVWGGPSSVRVVNWSTWATGSWRWARCRCMPSPAVLR
jgi:hypothetical protein